jgi:hypothetical protein
MPVCIPELTFVPDFHTGTYEYIYYIHVLSLHNGISFFAFKKYTGTSYFSISSAGIMI